jgi:hypothetical protein
MLLAEPGKSAIAPKTLSGTPEILPINANEGRNSSKHVPRQPEKNNGVNNGI